MPFFTRHLAKGGPEFWGLLREALLDLVPRVSREEFVHSVGAQDKVLVELIANDRRDAAVDYIENWGSDARRFPHHGDTRGGPGRAAADRGPARRRQRDVRPPAGADQPGDAGGLGRRPAHRRGLGLHPQPRPRRQPARDRSSSWSPPTAGPGSRWRPSRSTSRGSTCSGGHWHCDYRPGGFRAALARRRRCPATSTRTGPSSSPMTAAGVRRTSRLRDISSAGSSVGPADPSSTAAASPARVQRGLERNLVLRVTHYPMYAVSADRRRAPASRRVVFRTDGSDAPSGWWSTTSTRIGASCSAAPVTRGRARRVAGASSTSRRCRCRRPTRRRSGRSPARCGSGCATARASTPRCWPRPAPQPSPGVIDDPAVVRRLTRSKGGELELMDRVPVATDYALTDDAFTVRVHTRACRSRPSRRCSTPPTTRCPAP